MSAPVVFRLLTGAQWAAAQAAGALLPGPNDRASGFLHLSDRAHVLGTADRYFDPAVPLVAVALPVAALGPALRWEPVPARGADFPHLYADAVPIAAVAAVHRLVHDGRAFAWSGVPPG